MKFSGANLGLNLYACFLVLCDDARYPSVHQMTESRADTLSRQCRARSTSARWSLVVYVTRFLGRIIHTVRCGAVDDRHTAKATPTSSRDTGVPNTTNSSEPARHFTHTVDRAQFIPHRQRHPCSMELFCES